MSPEIVPALEGLVDPVTRGDSESPLRWTSKSTGSSSKSLSGLQGESAEGWPVAADGYSRQSTNKSLEGTTHPDRNRQFEFINDSVDAFHARGAPVGCTGNGPGLGKLYERQSSSKEAA